MVIKSLLQEVPELREELEDIWKSFKSENNLFDLRSIHAFIKDLVDFSQMIFAIAELPKPEISIEFTNLKSLADPFKKYFEDSDDIF